MRVRFFAPEHYDKRVQDHEWPCCPRKGERVEMMVADSDGAPGVFTFEVARVTHTVHDVVPADVVVELRDPV